MIDNISPLVHATPSNKNSISEKTEKIPQALAGKGEDGNRNTVSLPPEGLGLVPPSGGLIPLWKLAGTGNKHLVNTVNVFCDYLRFFTSNCQLNYWGLELIQTYYLKGLLFLDGNGCKGKQEFETEITYMGGQVHKGSSKTWSYMIENSIGVRLLVSDNGEFIDAVQLEFSGSPLKYLMARNNFLTLCQSIQLMQEIVPNIKVSRFDATAEFSHDLLDLMEVRKYHNEGNFFGSKVRHEIPGFGTIKIDGKRQEVIKGLTLYFGSKNTRLKKLKIYETFEKHGYHGIRYELTMGDFQARQFVENMLKIYNENEPEMTASSVVNHKTRAVKLTTNQRIRTYFLDYLFSLNTMCLIDKDRKRSNRSIYDQQHIIIPFWREFRSKMVTHDYVIKFDRSIAPIQKKFRSAMRNTMGLFRAIKDKFGENALVNTILDWVKLSEKKDSERFKNDPNFKSITGRSYSYKRNIAELSDLGDTAWVGILDDNLRECLRRLGLLHKYPKMFSQSGVTFPIFKNCDPQFHELVGIPF